MKQGITAKQRECYDAIKAYINDNGIAPSSRELTDILRLSSTAGVHRLLQGLEDRGWITKKAGRARSIALCESVDGLDMDDLIAKAYDHASQVMFDDEPIEAAVRFTIDYLQERNLI